MEVEDKQSESLLELHYQMKIYEKMMNPGRDLSKCFMSVGVLSPKQCNISCESIVFIGKNVNDRLEEVKLDIDSDNSYICVNHVDGDESVHIKNDSDVISDVAAKGAKSGNKKKNKKWTKANWLWYGLVRESRYSDMDCELSVHSESDQISVDDCDQDGWVVINEETQEKDDMNNEIVTTDSSTPDDCKNVCNKSEDNEQDVVALAMEKHEYGMNVFEHHFSRFEHLDRFSGKGSNKCLRKCKKRKKQKAHKQVKTVHCKSVKNNNGKKLFVKHRVYNNMRLEPKQLPNLPSRKRPNKTGINNNSSNATNTRATTGNGKNAQNTGNAAKYTLHNSNAPTAFDIATVASLIDLQHRELTPEDYEILLQLDQQVPVKTISSQTLAAFKTETVSQEIADQEQVCSVCMEVYELGQIRKYLPCDHVFHVKCIDMWLENSSMNCPLDGLAVT